MTSKLGQIDLVMVCEQSSSVQNYYSLYTYEMSELVGFKGLTSHSRHTMDHFRDDCTGADNGNKQ